MASQLNKSYADKGSIAIVDWSAVTTIFKSVSRENLLPEISAIVLQTGNSVSTVVLSKYIQNDSRENYIKTAIIYLMSTPEYQLC